MDANDNALSQITTHVRQLLLQYREEKRKNGELQATINERDATIEQLKEELQTAHSNYNSLKVARMVEITNGDMQSAQKRLSKLIRDVDKCITLLSKNSLDNG